MMSTLKPTSYFIEPIRYWKPKFCRAATGPGIGASPRAESLETVPLVIAVWRVPGLGESTQKS